MLVDKIRIANPQVKLHYLGRIVACEDYDYMV